ncbi:MAG: hypothetical protein QM765_19635 [Myxococcales bacterium]
MSTSGRSRVARLMYPATSVPGAMRVAVRGPSLGSISAVEGPRGASTGFWPRR